MYLLLLEMLNEKNIFFLQLRKQKMIQQGRSENTIRVIFHCNTGLAVAAQFFKIVI